MTAQDKLKDVGWLVFLTSAAVSLVGLGVTSGFSQEFVNEAIRTAEGGSAQASDYLRVLDVALSAFPFVVALVATYFVVAYTDWDSQGKLLATIALWVTAGFLSSAGDPTGMQARVAQTAGPWYVRALEWGVGATTAPYSGVLLVQALVVAGATIGGFEWLKERWSSPTPP